jgi:hypothetical protein
MVIASGFLLALGTPVLPNLPTLSGHPPKIGEGCNGSGAVLAASNIGDPVDSHETDVVNIWTVRYGAKQIGWVLKTRNGNVWFENLIHESTLLTPNNVQSYTGKRTIEPCFSGDLSD